MRVFFEKFVIKYKILLNLKCENSLNFSEDIYDWLEITKSMKMKNNRTEAY
jgi:hypothetical protein